MPGIATSATRGVLWTGGGQLLRQVVQIGTSVTLARLLVPEDFGVLGMAMVFVGVAQIFTDFGIGAAIIQSQTTDRRTLSSAFWANAAVAVALTLTIALLSPFIAAFYGNPRVAPVVAVASLTMLLAGLLVVPQACLLMRMRFHDVAKAQVIGTVTGSAAAITAAIFGSGVWSLVIQPIVGSTASLALMVWFSKWRPAFAFSWMSIRSFARFSTGVVASDVVTFAGRNADQFLIGKFIGSGPLGQYSLAYQMMLYPLQQVSSVFVRVLFPTLSLLKSDSVRYGQAYLTAVSAIAFVTFPMMMGLFCVADPFVAIVFGPKWQPVSDLLRILAFVGMIQSIGTTVGTIYLSSGHTKALFQVAALGTPVIVVGVAAGLPWGIRGVAAGYAAGSLAVFYFTVMRAFGLVSLRVRDLHTAVWRPLLCSGIMFCAVFATSAFAEFPSDLVRLIVLVALGVAVYAVATWAINRQQLVTIIGLARMAIGR